ncbi:MAG: zf-HC2 domain-containing protein [Longimicrobiales bacterium]
MTSEHVTDLLPDLAAGTVSSAAAAGIHAHLTSCDDCAAEWLLIQRLRATAPVAPAALADRITHAVMNRPVAPRSASWGIAQLTVAATVAIALVGGGIAIEQLRHDNARMNTSLSDTAVATGTTDSGTAATAAAYTPIVEPVLGGRSVVAELTEAQLKALLAEMGT